MDNGLPKQDPFFIENLGCLRDEDSTDDDRARIDNRVSPRVDSSSVDDESSLTTSSSSRPTSRVVDHEEHVSAMSALNDRWECELERAVRESEERLYEQARASAEIVVDASDLEEADSDARRAIDRVARLREECAESRRRLDADRAVDGAAERTRRRFLRVLEDSLDLEDEEDESVPSKNHDEDYTDDDTNESFDVGEEVRTSLRLFKSALRSEANTALLERERRLREENSLRLRTLEREFRQRKDDLLKAHEEKLRRLRDDHLLDRTLLVMEMREAYEEEQSQIAANPGFVVPPCLTNMIKKLCGATVVTPSKILD